MFGSKAEWIGLAVAVISLIGNVIQAYRHSILVKSVQGAMLAWWSASRAIRVSVERYWKAVAERGTFDDHIMGVARGTLDSVAEQSGHLAEAIAREMVSVGFKAPWDDQQEGSRGAAG